jgi:adenine-specific DNA-methyltransferase
VVYQVSLRHARALRRRSTDAESKLWYYLRDRRLFAARFRRQKPVGHWIVDFYCAQAKLVIEVDGGGHGDPRTMEEDARRTEDLERRGLRVLRFWNSDVLTNVEGVLITIAEALEKSPSP